MTAKLTVIRRDGEASAGRVIGDYPIRLFAHHMAEIFGLSLKAFYAQDAAGAFTFAENRPRIGRKSWSRDRVALHFSGELRGLTETRRRA